MNLKKILIVVALIASVCFLTYPASADVVYNEDFFFSGASVTFTSDTVASTGSPGGGNINPSLTGFRNDFSTVKYLNYIKTNATSIVNYDGGAARNEVSTSALNTNANGLYVKYTNFTADISGTYFGRGTLGWERVGTSSAFRYVVFFEDLNIGYITGLTGVNTITFTYDTTIYSSYLNIYMYDYSLNCAQHGASTTYFTISSCYATNGVYEVSPHYSTTLNVKVTNQTNNSFVTMNITKNAYSYRTKILNKIGGLYHDTTSATDLSLLFNTVDGLKFNIQLDVSGDWVNRTIYTDDGLLGPEEESPIPDIDPITGVGIKVTPTSGYQDTVFNISWLRNKSTPVTYHDYVVVYKTYVANDKCDWITDGGATCAIVLQDSPPNSGSFKTNVDRLGSWKTKFVRCWLSCGSVSGKNAEILASASFEVKAEQPSYLLVNATVLTKTNVPITYFIGTDLTGYVTGTKSLMMLEIREYDGTGFINPRYYNILNQNGTINHIFPLPKKYKVSLFDYLKGIQLYEKIVTAIYSPDDIILEKIKTSYITSDKSVYYYGEMITGTYGIDDTNFSQYNIVVSLLNETNGDTYCSYNAGENFDLKTGTFLYDFVQQSGNYYMGCEKAAGAANITLYRNNNSILERITSVSFNISNTNAAGYGLKISNLGCQKFGIAAISPAVAKLEIVDYNGKVERYFNFSGTLNIIYSAKTKAQYVFNLYDSAGTLQISQIMGGSLECIVPVVDDSEIYGGVTTVTCGFWDNCVNGMFPGQGLNNVTRLQFALFCIVVMMFFGMVVSKGNFGVSVILGFLPYAFFTYLTLSSPCGEYMPVWISIFIALIVGIKMKWFS